LRFSGCFRFLAGIDIHDIQRFTIISQLFSKLWPVGPLQLSVAPTAQTSSYATVQNTATLISLREP